jgi:hypothetical protein
MFHRSDPYICRDGLSFLILPSCHDIVIQLLNMTINANENDPLFSSPDPKGHVSYCHHLVSVVVVRRPSVVRRKLFQKSSPLKVLDQWKPNLV